MNKILENLSREEIDNVRVELLYYVKQQIKTVDGLASFIDYLWTLKTKLNNQTSLYPTLTQVVNKKAKLDADFVSSIAARLNGKNDKPIGSHSIYAGTLEIKVDKK